MGAKWCRFETKRTQIRQLTTTVEELESALVNVEYVVRKTSRKLDAIIEYLDVDIHDMKTVPMTASKRNKKGKR